MYLHVRSGFPVMKLRSCILMIQLIFIEELLTYCIIMSNYTLVL